MDAIVTTHLCKNYGDKIAVRDLNLSVRQGEVFALLGTNGAGKTTTIKMLTCLLRPTSGDACVMGHSVVDEPAKVKEIIGVSPQETAVAPLLTVRENLEFICGVFGLSKERAKAKCDELVNTFGMQEYEHKRANTLSGGYRRRLSIAIALVSEPKVLFLDEPTLGLDILSRRELWKVVRSLHDKTTVVLTTHYLDEAQSLSDEVGIMKDGNLVCVGSVENVIKRSGKSTFEDAFVSFVEENGI